MATIQIRNVPDDVYRELRKRAGAAGQSLQEYLLRRLSAEASRPSPEEFLARLRERPEAEGVSLGEAAEMVRAERSAR